MGIQASELRIGNWVEVSNRKGKVYQYAIGSNDFAELEKNSQDFSPIPLTPEILEKCGFVRTTLARHELGDFVLIMGAAGRSVDLAGKLLYYNGDLIWIRNLHQLQNLYFALTGEELNVQL